MRKAGSGSRRWPCSKPCRRQSYKQMLTVSVLQSVLARREGSGSGRWPYSRLQAMTKSKVQANAISFSAAIRACENGVVGSGSEGCLFFFKMQRVELEQDRVIYNCLLDAVRGKPFAIALFQRALQDGIYLKLAAAGPDSIDLHELSEGPTQLALWWWLYTLVLPELSNSVRSGTLCRCAVGWTGEFRTFEPRP